ncbi:hypothetical protein COB64_02525 [Candidatus Wolfebacteria bacterium]|nr:MAG: hypothetical protein COB64_02525 [Candidatus Wolfebacteria bacterium]
MKKRTIIPKCPQPFKIPQYAEKNIAKWIHYLKNVSPRIIIKMPYDKDLDLDVLKQKFKEGDYIEEDMKISDWPKKEQLAFLLSFDSSLPGHKRKFLIGNTYFFCYYGIAFGLGYFEWDGDGGENQNCTTYSLQSCPKSALTWEYITKIIIDRITEIENSVEKAP